MAPPVCVALPGAVETRFFLPLHLLLYAALAYATNVGDLLALVRRRWLVFALGGFITVSLFFGITFSTMASVERVPECGGPAD